MQFYNGKENRIMNPMATEHHILHPHCLLYDVTHVSQKLSSK